VSGRPVMPERVKSAAEIEKLEAILDFVRTRAGRAGFSRRRTMDLELAVEEAMANICRYAYPGGSGEVEVSCRTCSGGAFSIEITDRGRPFDLFTVEKPVFEDCLSRRKLGGLGIHLIRHMVDEVRYRRAGERNVLTLIMYEREERKTEGSNPRQGETAPHNAHNPSGAGL